MSMTLSVLRPFANAVIGTGTLSILSPFQARMRWGWDIPKSIASRGNLAAGHPDGQPPEWVPSA